MRIADILRSKGSAVATVTASTTVTGLLAELDVHNIGAMVVIGPDGVIGIVSERDVVRRLHTVGPDLLRRPVADIMSDVAVICAPDDHVDDLAALMTNNRVRHVPVLDVPEESIRREGAIIDRVTFEIVATRLRTEYSWS